MSLTSRNLNSALGACTPTKSSGDAGASASATSRSRQSSLGDSAGEVEAIRVAVRLKPLSANADYDEIDPQLGRAWRVIPETNTIVQESAALAGLADGLPTAAAGFGAFGAATPSKFATPAKSRLNGGGGSGLMAPPSTAGKHDRGKETTFTFDRVYGEDSTTSQIYDGMVKDIVGSVTEKGINGTVFAYGQTSSGKTFTMQGNRASARNNASRNGVDGITHMAARDIFDQIAADPQHSYAVRVSFLEIYNEEVRDLLVAGDGKSGAGGGGSGGNGSKQATLAVREDPKLGVFVENLTSHRVYNLDTLLHYLNLGEKHKSVAATGMNDRSSRSHTIFRITVERKKKVVVQQSSGAGPAVTLMLTPPPETNGGGKRGAKKNGGDGVKLVATLNLVDLAGSESVRHTGATGSRQKEGGKINQSLLTLSRVIMGLGKASSRKSGSNKTPFVNYRDSKLTRILQSSLSGNARMAVICCATLSDAYTEETKSTLQFASRAKLVKTRASANEIDEDPSVIKKLQREVAQRSEEGKQALRQLRELERQAKDAEKAKDDVDKRLKKLYDFVRTSDIIHLLSQDREYGQVLSTRNCSYEPALPALAKATPAKSFAKAPLLDRRSTMKKQFSESLFVRTSLDGSEGSGTMLEGGVTASAVKSSFISPRYNDTVSTFDQPSTHVTLLKDALAAKTTQVRKLMEESSKVDEAALDESRKEIDLLQKKAEYAAKEKEDALDWVEELHDKLEKAEREALEASDGKEVVSAENEQLREEIEKLKEIQAQSAGDSEKIVADLRAMYEEKNAALQRELQEAKEKATKHEKMFNSAKQDRDLMRERMERVSAERDEARTSTRELKQENTTLMESLDDLQVENDQALQIIEELTSEKQDLVAENESQQAQLKVFSQMETDHEELLKQVSAIQEERDDLLEQLNTVHSLVANKSPRNSESDGIQTLQIIEQLTDAMESNEALDSACRRMTSENQELREQLEHLNSSIQCQSDIAKSTEEELTAENLDLRDELAEVGKSAARARASMLAIEGEKQELSNKLVASEAKAKELRTSIDILEGEKDEILSELEASNAKATDLKATVDTLSSALEEAQSGSKRTQEERGALSKELSEASGRLQQALADIEDLKVELIKRTDERDESNAKVARFETEIASLTQKITALEMSLEQQRSDLLSSEKDLLAKVDAEKKNLKQAKEEAIAQVEELSSELANTLGRLAVESEKVETLSREKATLGEANDDLTSRVSALEVEKKEKEAQITEISTKLDAANAFKEELAQESKRILSVNSELSSKLNIAEEDAKDKADRLEVVTKDLTITQNELETFLSQARKEVKAKEEEISKLTSELSVANKNLDAIQTEIDTNGKTESKMKAIAIVERTKMEQEIKDLRKQAALSEEARMELETQYEEKCSEESALRKDITRLEKDLTAAMTQVDDVSALLEQTRSNLEKREAALSQEESLRQRLDAKSKENTTLHSQVDALQNTVEALTSELSNVTKELEQAKSTARVEASPSATSSEEVKELRSQIKDQTRFLASKDSELKNLQSKIQKLSFERDDAVAKMMRIRRESNTALTQVATLERQLQEKNNAIGSKTADMTKSMESLAESRSTLQREISRLEHQKAEAERLAKRVRRESSSTAVKNRELQNALNHANDCKEELEDRIRQYEQLIEESDKDHDRMMNERKVLLRDHSREVGALKRDKAAAERECALLMKRLEEMASHMDMLEAAKQSSEAKAQRLLEQKHRALNRLDNTKEETSRTIRAVETQSKLDQERERRIAEMRYRAIQAEKENELKARDTKLSLYEAERNNLGKTTKRSLSLVGREAKRGLAAAREKGSHVLRSRSNI